MTNALTKASGDTRRVLSFIAPPRWIEVLQALARIVAVKGSNPLGAPGIAGRRRSISLAQLGGITHREPGDDPLLSPSGTDQH